MLFVLCSWWACISYISRTTYSISSRANPASKMSAALQVVSEHLQDFLLKTGQQCRELLVRERRVFHCVERLELGYGHIDHMGGIEVLVGAFPGVKQVAVTLGFVNSTSEASERIGAIVRRISRTEWLKAVEIDGEKYLLS